LQQYKKAFPGRKAFPVPVRGYSAGNDIAAPAAVLSPAQAAAGNYARLHRAAMAQERRMIDKR
jgi:hypothetical protein